MIPEIKAKPSINLVGNSGLPIYFKTFIENDELGFEIFFNGNEGVWREISPSKKGTVSIEQIEIISKTPKLFEGSLKWPKKKYEDKHLRVDNAVICRLSIRDKISEFSLSEHYKQKIYMKVTLNRFSIQF